MEDDPYARFYTMDSDFDPPEAPPRMMGGGYGAPPTVLAIGVQDPWSAELGQPVSPQRQTVDRNPHQEDIDAVRRGALAGERIPLRIPAAYCEELFANCASEDESNLLRSVYFREAAASGRDYILDQGLVTPGDLTQRSSRIQLALRTAALAVSKQQKAHLSAPPASVEDPATKRKLVQQEHVIALQNRKIQELEARAARIKQVGHSFIEQPATAVELQEAQARLSVLKVHTDQQEEDIKKLESEVESAVQQLEQGSKINKSIKSLWDGSKLVDDNARLLKENDYARRQVDLKAQHLTELKFNLDQLKEMYDGTQQLVLHEGSALSSILAQKENEAKHLQQQRNKVQEEIKNTRPRNNSDKDLQDFRYKDLQARSRFSEAISHVNQLEQKLQSLRNEAERKTKLLHLKQSQLSDLRREVTTMTGKVQGKGPEFSKSTDVSSGESYLHQESLNPHYSKVLEVQLSELDSRIASWDSRIASPYIPTEKDQAQARRAAELAESRENTLATESAAHQKWRAKVDGTELRPGGIVVAAHKYERVHEDELHIEVGEVLRLVEESEDPGWFFAVNEYTGARGVVPTTHIKPHPIAAPQFQTF